MKTPKEIRDEIGGIAAIDAPGEDNLAIALATYFEKHPNRPSSDLEIEDETGWGEWVMNKTNDLMDRIVEHFCRNSSHEEVELKLVNRLSRLIEIVQENRSTRGHDFDAGRVDGFREALEIVCTSQRNMNAHSPNKTTVV